MFNMHDIPTKRLPAILRKAKHPKTGNAVAVEIVADAIAQRSTFRQTIAARAIALDLSLAEVSRRAGLTKSQLSSYVAGKREMRTDCLERLLGVLGIELTVPRARRKAKPDTQIRLARETLATVDGLIGIIRKREGVELSRPKLVMRALCSLLLILRPDLIKHDSNQPPQPAHPA